MCPFLGLGARKPKSDWEAMSTILQADARLRKNGGGAPDRQAGIVFQPDDLPYLANLERELNPVLYQGEGATKTSFRIQDDDQGARWVVLDDGNFADLISSAYTVGNAISVNGGEKQLLAAVFRYHYTTTDGDGLTTVQPAVYWIYAYRLKAFYPFVPSGEEERDRPAEVGLARHMQKAGLEIDQSLEDWYGLWGIPF